MIAGDVTHPRVDHIMHKVLSISIKVVPVSKRPMRVLGRPADVECLSKNPARTPVIAHKSHLLNSIKDFITLVELRTSNGISEETRWGKHTPKLSIQCSYLSVSKSCNIATSARQ